LKIPLVRYDGVVHEFSVCQAMLTQVAELAAGRGASAVERITIEVGPLSGVEPALLASAFAVLRSGGCAAQASLLIESTPVTIGCLTCAGQSQTSPSRLVCPLCGGFRTRIVAGDELRLRRVELRVANLQLEAAASS
jgi:hydrogenase nickel incorporation protein HypA/HybF